MSLAEQVAEWVSEAYNIVVVVPGRWPVELTDEVRVEGGWITGARWKDGRMTDEWVWINLAHVVSVERN